MRCNRTFGNNSGLTLIELMVVVAILGIISAIALPMYRGYIDTSREGVLVNNISTIEIFQEDFRLRTGDYYTGPGNLAAIETAIGWQPSGDGTTTYSIAAGPPDTYEVTAVDDAGVTVCIQFPDKTRC